MKSKKFAETLISQCLEDLFDPKHMMQSVDFFAGKEFHVVAIMAEMSPNDRIQILKMVNDTIKSIRKNMLKTMPKQAGRAKNLPSCPACSPHSPVAV